MRSNLMVKATKFFSSSIVILTVSACGCFQGPQVASGNDKKNAKKDKASLKSEASATKVQDPQVQLKWQRKFIELFEKQDKQTNQAWALFSYGGWSDEGQVIVFGKNGKSGISMLAKPGSKKVDSETTVSENVIKAFIEGEAKYLKLNNFDTGVMDGVQYEYVRAVRDSNGKVSISQRVFMNNPGVGKPAPEYVELIKMFGKLKHTKG